MHRCSFPGPAEVELGQRRIGQNQDPPKPWHDHEFVRRCFADVPMLKLPSNALWEVWEHFDGKRAYLANPDAARR